jgi:hypothetical protein
MASPAFARVLCALLRRYNLVVTVVDRGGLSATSTVVVNVLNVNDVSVTGFEDTVQLSTLGNECVLKLGLFGSL